MSTYTIKDVALEAGVSTATVSRVLNQKGFVSDDIKQRVYLAVKKLNYKPNAIARSLKHEKTNTIGVIIPDISNPFFMKISKGIEDIVQQAGYNLIFCSSDEDPTKEEKLLQLMYEQRVNAIVLATSGSNNKEFVRTIKKAGIPVVLVDRTFDIEGKELDSVTEANKQSMYELTKMLIEKGHRNIGFITGLLNVSTGKERFEGYRLALEEYGIELDDKYIFNGTFTQDDGVRAVDYFLNFAQKPSAILSSNNNMTFGVLLELSKRGYSIPNDMAVASFGDLDAFKLLNSPGIISVVHKPYEMGKKVGDILMKRFNNEQGPFTEIFKPGLVIHK